MCSISLVVYSGLLFLLQHQTYILFPSVFQTFPIGVNFDSILQSQWLTFCNSTSDRSKSDHVIGKDVGDSGILSLFSQRRVWQSRNLRINTTLWPFEYPMYTNSLQMCIAMTLKYHTKLMPWSFFWQLCGFLCYKEGRVIIASFITYNVSKSVNSLQQIDSIWCSLK